MKNPETKHIIACIILCGMGMLLLAISNDIGSSIMPLEILPGVTFGQALIGWIGLLCLFIGLIYAGIRLMISMHHKK